MLHSISNIFSTLILLFALALQCKSQHVQFTSNQTPTWQQCISMYDSLDRASDVAQLTEVGTTDIGKPLHLFIINKDQIFYPELFDRKKSVLLINNAIHPGEPDGVDACLILCKELLQPNSPIAPLMDSTIICIIPMYNVDGALNRGEHSRANQNGPEEYGFRGNARNLDLNRDFIKCDSKNAQSFSQLFGRIKPNVIVDTHVSNGADYPYTMTLITTQTDKLGGPLGKYLKEKMEPALFNAMKINGHEMCPYVNTMGRTPESGLIDFLETPRFATGYAALFGTIGFTTETHMLKPYAKRVESTYQFLICLLKNIGEDPSVINKLQKQSIDEWKKMKRIYLNYQLDTTQKELFSFNGYIGESRPTEVGTGTRLFYNHNAPWTKSINHYTTYGGADEVKIPQAYIIPQAWTETIERLQWNNVQMTLLKNDTVITVTSYYLDDYETSQRPYEGHYLHSKVKVRSEQQKIKFYVGDYVVDTSQPAIRYIATVLEPQSEDSFFAWNFFDSVLQQKEWFSDYVFEDIAAELLKNDSKLKNDFDRALENDVSLKDNHWNQLYWIYRHSDYYEKSANRYPVFRVE